MKRSKHNLSHYKLLTGDMGQLLPIGCIEVLPGDTFQHSTSLLVRVTPMAAPVMHPIQVRIHHFFVPNRLVWDGWEDFITGGADGKDIQTIPTIDSTSTLNDLLDYMGIPNFEGVPVNALPVRGFNLIFNEYYRDQDLVTERVDDDVTIPFIAWEKDYFTSARPWEQKGDDITVPVGEEAVVRGIGKINQTFTSGQQTVYESGQSGTTTYTTSARLDGTNADIQWAGEEDPNNPGFPRIYADLANATGVDINDFRKAFALQRFQEARARYGSRYTEYLRYLGVRPSDARLQRPEYLGGGKVKVQISEVLQTAPETGVEPPITEYGVGDMYGHGIAAMRSNRYRRFFEEHGYVLSLVSVRPKAIYETGVDRHWLKRDREDYFQKELQFIGQQPVLKGELYMDEQSQETFGYADRYREYREHPSKVAGEFRHLLAYWHLARNFDSSPALNKSFIECVPSKRIFNEQTQHSLWMAAQHSLVARRLVSRNASARIL